MMLDRLVVAAITWSLQPVTLHCVVTYWLVEGTAPVNCLACTVWMRRHVCLIQRDIVCDWLLVVAARASLESRWLVCMPLRHLVVELRGGRWCEQMVYVVSLLGDLMHWRLCIFTVWGTQWYFRDLTMNEQKTWQHYYYYYKLLNAIEFSSSQGP